MEKKIIFIFMLFIIANTICGQSRIIVAASDAWPPFVDDKNPTDGLSLEIIRAAYKTQGYQVKMEYVPWVRAENGVNNCRYDILPNTWLTEKRKAKLNFSEPYAYNKIMFIKNKDDSFEFIDLSSLTGKIIGTIRGYGYSNEFVEATNFQREEVPTFMQNIKKMLVGRVDLTLEDEIVALSILTKEDPKLLKNIVFCQKPLSLNGLYVTCSLTNPRQKEFIDAFNAGLKIIKKNGTYTKIMKQYGIR